MSLFNTMFDDDWPFGGGRRYHRHRQDPFFPVTALAVRVPFQVENHALSRFLDNEFREMQQLERQMMDVQTRAEGNQLSFGCNVVGYTPEELKVNVEGDQLVIEGEHREEHGGQSIHRQFTRRITLPDGVARDSVQCNLDDKGQLTVQADYPKAEKPQTRQIPIGFKKAPEAVEQQKKQEEKKQ